MTGFRLRPAARRDLEEIWRDTVRNWSEKQAETYIRALSAAFELLVEYPEIERERTELNPPLRIKRSGSHLILYQIADDCIDVVRIRHVREDWMNDPVGDDA